MNAKERMNRRIEKHGEDLKRIFNIQNIGAVELSKKVRRIEVTAHRMAEDYCNGVIDPGENGDEWLDMKDKLILKALDKVLNFKAQNIPVFYNTDPRGYALKIDDEYVKANSLDIHRDWGGYGILAPEFDGKR